MMPGSPLAAVHERPVPFARNGLHCWCPGCGPGPIPSSAGRSKIRVRSGRHFPATAARSSAAMTSCWQRRRRDPDKRGSNPGSGRRSLSRPAASAGAMTVRTWTSRAADISMASEAGDQLCGSPETRSARKASPCGVPPWLAREHNFSAPAAKVFSQPSGLRGLATAFAALQRDEETARQPPNAMIMALSSAFCHMDSMASTDVDVMTGSSATARPSMKTFTVPTTSPAFTGASSGPCVVEFDLCRLALFLGQSNAERTLGHKVNPICGAAPHARLAQPWSPSA
jgi:hypothetical protein